jgi:hypothetical protein
MITSFKIYGERNTGTNYISALIKENTDLIDLGGHWDTKYGWKHDIINTNKIISDSENSKTLFLHIYKNPYSWILSMRRKPHHMPHLRNLELPAFINHKWDERSLFKTSNRVGLNINLKSYDNIIDLRYQKITSHSSLKNIVNNYFEISYESLMNDPDLFIQNICNEFNLEKPISFKNITEKCEPITANGIPYKILNDYYINEKWKDRLNKEVIEQINNKLNIELEKKLGYTIL